MKIRTLRRVLAILILLLSLALLIWGLWPWFEFSNVVPVPPSEMQLPTPGGWVPPFLEIG